VGSLRHIDDDVSVGRTGSNKSTKSQISTCRWYRLRGHANRLARFSLCILDGKLRSIIVSGQASNDGKRILLCEDNPRIAALLQTVLHPDGFSVAIARSASETRDLVVSWLPDLILLDIYLPETDTAVFALLEELRNLTPVPIIVISGLGRSANRVRALRKGADDYITKPFDTEEVRARVTAVLRRGRPTPASKGLFVDDIRKEAVVRGRRASLSPKEFLLLRLLASVHGAVVTTDDIIEELWPTPARTCPTSQDVQKYVYLLRKKVEHDPSAPQFIMTERGGGYRLAV